MLTPRELQCLRLVATGKSYRNVSLILGNSVQQVKRHMIAVYAKLGALSGAHAVALMDDGTPGWRPLA